jgi:hypothetical protein
VLEIAREKEGRHAAGAELTLDLIAAADGGVEVSNRRRVAAAHRAFSAEMSLARLRRAASTRGCNSYRPYSPSARNETPTTADLLHI